MKEAEEVREASTSIFKSSIARLEQQCGILERRIQTLHLGITVHSKKPFNAKVCVLSFGLPLPIYPCMHYLGMEALMGINTILDFTIP